MNNLKKLKGLTVVGYYCKQTKKVYKTKAAIKAAATKLKNVTLKKVALIKKEVEILRDYVKNTLSKTTSSFKRWSEFLEIKRYLKLAKIDTPRGYRHLINYNL